MNYMDFMDAMYCGILNCTTNELDIFAEYASDTEITEFNFIVIALLEGDMKDFDKAKQMLNKYKFKLN